MTAREAVNEFEGNIITLRQEYPESDIFVDAATKLGVEIVSKTLRERKEIEAKLIEYVKKNLNDKFMYDTSVNAISACKSHKAYVKQIYRYAQL